MTNKYEGINFWIYVPNKVAAIIFVFAFFATAVIHLWQCYHYKTFKVTGLFAIGGLLYVIGFAIRVSGAFGNYDELAPFVLSVALIYVSPPLLSLADYDILGRVFYYVPYLAPMDPGKVMTTFGLLAMVIEGVNGVAASFIANPESNPQLGSALLWTAIALQIAIIAFFLGLVGFFHRRCIQAGMAWAPGIRQPLITLYVSMGLILARTIYRGIEHSIAAVSNTEWPFYVFEATLMFINMVMWNVRHPGQYLPADTKTYLSRDGITELQAPEKQKSGSGSRPEFSLKLLSPLYWISLLFQPSKLKRMFRRDRGEEWNEVHSVEPV
ncbi:uncharacterized protein F4822DRAFT_414359 [Hypoxylon trugodes]|uniref:uncharacterized protein n=1 Tax=Hypoxylon trugodes TaxID=326681 RepID=UPI00218E20A2|nr:uncharacterized protein F4822DRAFT_414359 [Hypoxylon trugodes]KAI1385871.1 hypothetical protein F4822DRAFT_414359 [Hypoxylon trugodes]